MGSEDQVVTIPNADPFVSIPRISLLALVRFDGLESEFPKESPHIAIRIVDDCSTRLNLDSSDFENVESPSYMLRALVYVDASLGSEKSTKEESNGRARDAASHDGQVDLLSIHGDTFVSDKFSSGDRSR